MWPALTLPFMICCLVLSNQWWLGEDSVPFSFFFSPRVSHFSQMADAGREKNSLKNVGATIQRWGLGCRNEHTWGQCCPHGTELLRVGVHLPHLLALKMLFLGAQSFLLKFRAAKTAGKPPSPPSPSQVPHTPTAACGEMRE